MKIVLNYLKESGKLYSQEEMLVPDHFKIHNIERSVRELAQLGKLPGLASTAPEFDIHIDLPSGGSILIPLEHQKSIVTLGDMLERVQEKRTKRKKKNLQSSLRFLMGTAIHAATELEEAGDDDLWMDLKDIAEKIEKDYLLPEFCEDDLVYPIR